jgi:hypothetical protein
LNCGNKRLYPDAKKTAPISSELPDSGSNIAGIRELAVIMTRPKNEYLLKKEKQK